MTAIEEVRKDKKAAEQRIVDLLMALEEVHGIVITAVDLEREPGTYFGRRLRICSVTIRAEL